MMNRDNRAVLEADDLAAVNRTRRFARFWARENIQFVKRIIVAVLGGTVLLLGIALLVLPGPAFIVIPIGLAILATEFAWARYWLKRVRGLASRVVSRSHR